jgi:hypothetical protein
VLSATSTVVHPAHLRGCAPCAPAFVCAVLVIRLRPTPADTRVNPLASIHSVTPGGLQSEDRRQKAAPDQRICQAQNGLFQIRHRPSSSLHVTVWMLGVSAAKGVGVRRNDSIANGRGGGVIVTALLTTQIVRVTHGIHEATAMIDEILSTDHRESETTLNVGDEAFYQSKKDGPFPNHQFRVSVRPSTGFAACNYMDHDDRRMPIANSWNPRQPPPDVALIFNGAMGSVFPRSAAIPIPDVRRALLEWLDTRRRPTCIEWRPYDQY